MYSSVCICTNQFVLVVLESYWNPNDLDMSGYVPASEYVCTLLWCICQYILICTRTNRLSLNLDLPKTQVTSKVLFSS